MKSKRATWSLLVVLVFLGLFLISRWREPAAREALERHPAELVYTRHAICRMQCRHISREEVMEILSHGIIHFNKSNRGARPCPTFALQGRTASGERIEVIFAQCREQTRVVTCYNLQKEFDCECP